MQGKPRVLAYAEVLNLVNPQIRVEGYQTNLESKIDQELLFGSSVVLENN